ncbi:MAG: RluA family pseudouridine synthase [Burkholderiaceae bacterium]
MSLPIDQAAPLPDAAPLNPCNDDTAPDDPDFDLRVIALGAAEHGLRLDRALTQRVGEFSRSYLQQLITSGSVRRNGSPVLRPAMRVLAGDTLALELRPTLQSQAFTPEVMSLDTVFEDAHLRVVNKPAGLVVHPAPGNWSGTLLNGLLACDPQSALLPRAGIVHRLDKDTSGLMVVARSRAVMDALVQLIALRDISRQYLALAHQPWPTTGPRSMDAPIGRDPRNRLRMAVVDLTHQAGKEARTEFRLLENAAQGCLLHCALHTGRTHQIRVHLAHMGHPLVADELYGGKAAVGMQRQALHASRLAFVHPVTAQALAFFAPLPQDMVAGLRQWGLGYNDC